MQLAIAVLVFAATLIGLPSFIGYAYVFWMSGWGDFLGSLVLTITFAFWVTSVCWLVERLRNWRGAALILLCLLAAAPAFAVERSREVTRQFQQLHPCPATGKTTGTCPGYVKDHINPLCNGGPDAVSNLQWQTIEDAKVKDRWERRICRHHPGTGAVSLIPYLE